jgi:hypothetical protein
MVIGDAEIWSDTFPQELVPRLVDLVTDTWASFPKPSSSDREVPITRRFKHVLKQAKDFKRLPIRVEREPAEDDPNTGEELGRIDLKFLPAISAREEVYFAFECKRLNAVIGGVRRSLAPEYVTEGMMRFVTGQYASLGTHGGMIGYVLDGSGPDAISSVDENVRSRLVELCMSTSSGLQPSSLRPVNNLIRETNHNLLPQRPFRLHHLFLECRVLPVATDSQ